MDSLSYFLLSYSSPPKAHTTGAEVPRQDAKALRVDATFATTTKSCHGTVRSLFVEQQQHQVTASPRYSCESVTSSTFFLVASSVSNVPRRYVTA